jgi:hypothetical protein
MYYTLRYVDALYPDDVPDDLLDELRPADHEHEIDLLRNVRSGRTIEHRWPDDDVVQRLFADRTGLWRDVAPEFALMLERADSSHLDQLECRTPDAEDPPHG